MGRYRTWWRGIVVHGEVTAEGWLLLLVVGWHSVGDSTRSSSSGRANSKAFDLAPK